MILKFIHRQFPSFMKLKIKFFNAYVWSHLYIMSTIYCLFFKTISSSGSIFLQKMPKIDILLISMPKRRLSLSFSSAYNLKKIQKMFIETSERTSNCMNQSLSNVYYTTSTYSMRFLIIMELNLTQETCHQLIQIKELRRCFDNDCSIFFIITHYCCTHFTFEQFLVFLSS